MGRKRQDVTHAELAVLHVLWEKGSATIRQLTELIYPAGTLSDYATVKKLLARLEEKGCVARDRAHTAHRFAATMSQDELIGRRLQAVADNLCGGSRTPLLLNLLRSERLSAQQRRELRQLLESLAPDPGQTQTRSRDADITRNRRK
jgi:predicted transcriptional regulator